MYRKIHITTILGLWKVGNCVWYENSMDGGFFGDSAVMESKH